MKIRSVNFSFKFIRGVFVKYYARPFSFLLSVHAYFEAQLLFSDAELKT